jgi:tetratricopeptide (TPR) repeat protein
MVMSYDTENGSQTHWLTWLEGATVAGAVGGTVISAVMNQVLFATVPLSLAAALNFTNRQRMQSVMQHQVMPKIDLQAVQLEQQQDKHQALLASTESLSSTSAATDQLLMIQFNKFHNETAETLNGLQETVNSLRTQSEEMASKQTELLESTAEESCCRRGLEHVNRGDFKEAVAAFSEAIRLNPNYAQAYIHRGAAYAETSMKQQAIADLRVATKMCFESGDLDNYNTARALSEQIHNGKSNREVVREVVREVPASAADKIVVDELFV